MRPDEQTVLNKIGKALAKPLSHLVANSLTESPARLAEAYWSILLGKGAGTGWAIDAEIRAARSFIHGPAPTIFDVGANLGEWSSLIQQHYPRSRLFLFEPQPACRDTIDQRRLHNATLVPCAVSSTSGQAISLFTSGEAAGEASLHQRRDSYFQAKRYTPIEVRTLTIDDTIEQHSIERVDFMKIDVEGHEFEVLKGATKSLESGVVKALSFEFGSGNINSRTFFHDFWDLLHPLRYEIFRILPSSRLMPIRRYYEDCEHFRGVTNYVAALPDAA